MKQKHNTLKESVEKLSPDLNDTDKKINFSKKNILFIFLKNIIDFTLQDICRQAIFITSTYNYIIKIYTIKFPNLLHLIPFILLLNMEVYQCRFTATIVLSQLTISITSG